MSTTPKTQITELSATAANQAVVVNGGWSIVDQLLDRTVKSRAVNTPPGSPSDGDAYIVGSSPSGLWSGQAGRIAFWRTSSTVWTFIVPRAGWRISVSDELDANSVPITYAYTGSAWVLPASTAGANFSQVVAESTTSRTLALSDAGKYIRTGNASSTTITVPPQSAVAWNADTEIHVEQGAAGQVTVAAGSGVTINRISGTNAKTRGPYAVLTLKRVASDTWTLFGLLESA